MNDERRRPARNAAATATAADDSTAAGTRSLIDDLSELDEIVREAGRRHLAGDDAGALAQLADVKILLGETVADLARSIGAPA